MNRPTYVTLPILTLLGALLGAVSQLCPCPSTIGLGVLPPHVVDRKVGESASFTCTRFCEENLELSNTWIWSTKKVRCASPTQREEECNHSLNGMSVALNLTESPCNYNNRTNFSLIIPHIIAEMNDSQILCQVDGLHDLYAESWIAPQSFRLLVTSNNESIASSTKYDCNQVISNMTTLPVPLGGSVTLNCSRICGALVFDRWRLYPENRDTVAINQNQPHLKDTFETNTGVTLTLSNENCSDSVVRYSLTVGNITRAVDGLIVECGARNTADTNDEWYATHKTKLVVEGYSTHITTDMNYAKTVTIGGNATLSCSRVCGPRIFDRWRLYPKEGNLIAVNHMQKQLKEEFENKFNVTLILSNEDYPGCDGEMVKYSLIIANITKAVDGLIVECGARNTDTNDYWYATHKTELHIDNSYAEIITKSMFDTVVASGSTATMNCSRLCHSHTQDSWLLQFESDNSTGTVISANSQSTVEAIERETGVTLTLRGTDHRVSCENEFVDYSLSIGNINENVSGLVVTCGAQRTDIIEEWFAPHSVKLILENNTELSMLKIRNQNLSMQHEKCVTEIECLEAAIGQYKVELENKTAAIKQYRIEIETNKENISILMAEKEKLIADKNVSIWSTTPIIGILILIIFILIISLLVLCVCCSCVRHPRVPNPPSVSKNLTMSNKAVQKDLETFI